MFTGDNNDKLLDNLLLELQNTKLSLANYMFNL